jgi:serine/threonine protein kinase
MVAELSSHFSQLEILEVLGHGGMGVVYKARQIELDRLVALKILRPNISHDTGFAARFLREARALAKLNHPNIITVYDFGRKEALFFFIMEFVDGANLRHVERVGQLSPAEALSIVPQVCSALQYAHDNGVEHRDIKPENILITKSGDVRIADFGLAKLVGNKDDAPLTGTWQVMGTPHYMAPQQFEKPTTVDHRADIYSLGVVIYELLTGELPIGRFRLPSEKVQVDVRLDEVVLRSLDKESDRRYQRVTDVATAVEEASVASPVATKAWSSAARHTEQAKRNVGNATEYAFEKAKELQAKSQKLTIHAHGLGTALMVVSVVDIVAAMLLMMNEPSRDPIEFLCGTAMIAGCVTFWFGRQYRRQAVSARLWWAVVLSLPWCSPLFIFSFIRMLLSMLMLLATAKTEARTVQALAGETPEKPEPPKPDFVDRMLTVGGLIWKAATVRRLFFSCFGVLGWCGLCVGAFTLFFNIWYYQPVDSYYTYKEGVSDIRVKAGDIKSLIINVSGGGSGSTKGMEITQVRPELNSLLLSVEGKFRMAHLEIELPSKRVVLQPDRVAEHRSLNRETVEAWVSKAVDDIGDADVQRLIDHLFEFISIAATTRGMTSRITAADLQRCPSLQGPIARVLRDAPGINHGMIRLSEFLNPALLQVADTDSRPNFVMKPNRSAPPTHFVIIAVGIWLVGFVRVLRILYQLLWRSPEQNESAEAALRSDRRHWNWCWIALLFWMLAAGLGCLYSGMGVRYIKQPITSPDLPFSLHAYTFLAALITAEAFCAIALVCALIARPLLRSLGWYAGAVAATIAVLVPPLSLLTFPTGLATWIQLTDGTTKRLFAGLSVAVQEPVSDTRDQVAT